MRAHDMNFDTHKHIKTLISKGASEEMAEAIVTMVTLVKSQDTQGLATKDQVIAVEEKLCNKITQAESRLKEDIASVRTELKEDIASVRVEIGEVRTELKEDIASVKNDITNIKYDMLKWIIPLFVATIVTILYSAK